jgi:hypothetical protein
VVAVDQGVLGGKGQAAHRPGHRRQAGVQDVEPVDLARFRNSDGDAAWLRMATASVVAPLGGELFLNR